MTQPFFIKVKTAEKTDFVNIAHVVRIEIRNTTSGQPENGTLHLENGTAIPLEGNEVSWIMRIMPDLIGEPASRRSSWQEERE